VLPMNGEAGVFPALEVLEAPLDHGPIQVLLGLDILCRGVFTMSCDGHFTFSLSLILCLPWPPSTCDTLSQRGSLPHPRGGTVVPRLRTHSRAGAVPL
jgi:hypothetical protein